MYAVFVWKCVLMEGKNLLTGEKVFDKMKPNNQNVLEKVDIKWQLQ
ncbi:hypothetical protein TheetDRAFT_1523 [Thermoanaerobacter ethanolicus JW 200]|nr:hypothetical protein TheetDRAFT_1523 [Thermoanaerobacter ethanolicus JW 200]